MNHQIDHGEIDHILAAFREHLVVFAHTPVSTDPGEGALDDPAVRKKFEANGIVRPLHDVEHPASQLFCPADEFPRVSAVGPDALQPRKQSPQFAQHEFGTIAILHIGRMHHDGQDQPQRVDDDVPLATLDLLARVVTSAPPFSVVLTLWLSMIAAEGVGLRPPFLRTFSRRAS